MPFFPEGFTEGLSIPSSSHHQRRSSSRHRTSKRRRSRSSSRDRYRERDRGLGGSVISDFFGKDSTYSKHNASRGSFFGLPLGNSSRGSFSLFGAPRTGNSRSSYYKRSPRKGFMQRTYKQLKRLLRDLIHWFKRHPWKVFFMVIMPLVTGGALTALLARFGLRMPPSLERALGMASRAASGDGFGFVSDAVRMAGGTSAGSTRGGAFAGSSSHDGYSRRGGGSFDAFEDFARSRTHGGGGDDWTSGLVNGVAKMFI
ncbi:hypothetical protein BBAD15_g1641 [Beauveria bassiana D1-5]|uniref:Uncharacterized protein n=1 Tax=Beauveria bassiana D1-5 TaxID=1245745 RepID=A0A0A2W1X9_BEABA|nr:hypothetical protein BBAD15_g1641 [Beauveria bassiana D1-5]